VIFFSSAPSIRSHGFAVAVIVAADNDILGMIPILRAGQGPWLNSKKLDIALKSDAEALTTALCNNFFFDWWAY
jgi:hypothetical protein